MGQTVSNQNKSIVHAGSGHVAQTGADICTLPVPAAYDNKVSSSNLAAGKAAKTTIGGHAVGMEGSHWDPSTSVGKVGVGSGTTQAHAWVASGSSDVMVEGKPVARAGDPTKQNAGNSSGSVTPGSIKPGADTVEQRAKKRCTITDLTGGGNSATLGYKGSNTDGDPNYLEVWDTDTLTFHAVRQDISQTPPVKNPDCEAPTQGGKTHTIWEAAGKQFPLYLQTERKTADGTEEFTFPANMVVAPYASPGVMRALGNLHMGEAVQKALLNHQNGPWARTEGTETAGEAGHADDRGAAAPGKGKFIKGGEGYDIQRYAKDHKNPAKAGQIKKATYAKEAGKDAPGKLFQANVAETMLFLWWGVKPPSINVTATGCAGARSATVVVLPNYCLTMSFNLSEGVKRAGAFAKGHAERLKQARRDEQQAHRAENKAERASNKADASRDAARRHRDRVFGEHGQLQDVKNPTVQERRNRSAKLAKAEADARTAALKFEAASRRVEQAKEALKTAEKFIWFARKMAALGRVKLEFEFLKDICLDIEASYERTENRKSAMGWRYYTDATMGLRIKVAFSGLIIDLAFFPRINLLRFVDIYIPGASYAAAKLGFRVDLIFRLEINLKLEASITKDQHDAFAGGGLAQLNAKPGLSLEAAAAHITVVRFSAVLPFRGEIEFLKPDKSKPNLLMEAAPKVFISNFVSLVIFPDRWWGNYTLLKKSLRNLYYEYNDDKKVRFPVLHRPQ